MKIELNEEEVQLLRAALRNHHDIGNDAAHPAPEAQGAREALARIALTTRNNMSPAHVLLAECGKIANAAIAAQRKEGES